jgi:hypothetical protein
MTANRVTLILSKSQDEHVRRLVTELDKLGHPWILFDPGDFPAQAELMARLGDGTSESKIRLSDGTRLQLEEIGSVWYRRPTPISASAELPDLEKTFIEREARSGLWGLLRGLDAVWVNHPDANRAAAYKPRQLRVAQSLGLAIPRTLITNEPHTLRQFYAACAGKVIYKLMGFPLFEDREALPLSTYTSLVPEEMMSQAHRIRATAHMFQEYIEKVCDVRVVVIDQDVFAVAVYPLSDEAHIDFRRDYNALRYEVHHLPDTVQKALLAMNRYYHLVYTAVDLLYTRDGRYVFLETNPVGQFGWLEDPTGLPLYQSLATLLAGSTL